MTSRAGPVPVILVDDTHTTILDEANTSVRVTIVSGAAGGTSSTDDGAFTAGSGSGTPAMGFFSADTVDAGDVGVLAMDASRRLLVSLEVDNVGIGGGTQYTEDAAAAANPVGTALIMVRDDALSGQTTTDGDNVAARGTDKGELYVKHADTMVVDGSGVTQPVSGSVTANAGTNLNTSALLTTAAHDAAFGTAGAADAQVRTVQGVASMTPLLVDGSAVTQPVSGTVTANLSATDNAVLDTIAASLALLDNAIAVGSELQVDVVAALPAGTNAIGKLAANTGVDIGDVDILSIAAGDNNIGNVDIVSLPASTNTLEVVGDVAADVGAAGNPVGIGGQAVATDDTAPPTRVSAESDRTALATDLDGAIFARPHGPQVWNYHLTTSTAQTDTSVHASPGAGLSLYVTDIVFSHLGTAAINVFFEESTTTVLGPYYLANAAGGFALQFQVPKKITADTALTITTSASHAQSIDVHGFVGDA